jgi:copper transport protein
VTPQARPTGRHRVLGPVAVLLVALAIVLGAVAPASAHAELVSSDPAEGAVLDSAPATVTLTFSEPFRLTSQELAVDDAERDPVASSAGASGTEVEVDLADAADLPGGTYVVSWNVLSGDGHPISGALTFSVGAPSTSVVTPPEAQSSPRAVTVLRDVLAGLSLVGLLLAAGLALFVALVLPRSWPGSEVRARLRAWTLGAAVAGATGALLGTPLAAAYAQGLGLDAAPGAVGLSLVVNDVLAAAMVVLGLTVIALAATGAPPDRTRGLLLVGGAAVALAGPSVVGHTRAFTPSPLLMVADVLHVGAGAVWLGGLVGLVLSLRALAGRELLAAQVLARFSTLAGGLLLAFAVTGTFLAWRILGSWGGLVQTAYGWLLLTKIALALVVVGLGGWNRWRTLPAVAAAVGYGDRERAAVTVTRTVRVEAVLLVVLLGVTGFLTNQSPRPAPVTAPSGTTGVGTATAGDLRVLAVMDPRRTGSNTVLVQVQDASGEPYDPPVNPVVELRADGLDLGAVTMTPIAAGTYRGQVVVPRAGEWEVQVSIALGRFDNPVTTVRLTVRP